MGLWIQIIIAIFSALPTIINLLKEIYAAIQKAPPALQLEMRSEVESAVADCKLDRSCGKDPNHPKLIERLQVVLDRLKRAQ